MANIARTSSASVTLADHIDDKLYGGDTFRAEIVLTLDADGIAILDMRSVPANSWIENRAANSGNEIEWTARTREEGPFRPEPETIAEMIAEIAPLLAHVHADHSLITEDFELVGKLTEDAEEAEEEIQASLDWAKWRTSDGVIDAIDWFESIDWEGVAVTANSTNAELKAIVAPLTRQASDASECIVHDVYYALDYRRRQLQDAEDE
ncbi:hypothetical protein OF122_02125 [Pelagibacterium flavum]|uniref:Uncharacterized protein n=1 Tax=Pelagibacterium flavum TaxID=2984530 RepID=A0ABY6ISD6_9HYPH|nr:hypothetical protein [Pelagibacterium sp. YIM 151497]UYQ72605.1 hypothetical protein OF122_02125 [Pelagibacterium sp. YIM 151497]